MLGEIDAFDAFYEKEDYRPPWRLSRSELNLLLITSVGFFIDSYDLFNINLVVPILNFVVNGEKIFSPGENPATIKNAPLGGGLLKASANIGCVIGQIGFGLLGDVFGRKAVYGKEMMLTALATILIIAVPLSMGASAFTYITIWRIVMGVGIGGDYPMSASVVADRANLKRRGTMIAFTFSMQGWGSFVGAVVFLILMAIFKKGAEVDNHPSQLNAVWRIYTGIILIPAFITIVQRLMLPESAKMLNVQEVRRDPSLIMRGSRHRPQDTDSRGDTPTEYLAEGIAGTRAAKAQAWADFTDYFSEWRHAKVLIGTTMSWLLLDLIFYGIALNQALFISALGFASSQNPWEYLWQQGVANIVIAIGGFLPGYYVTMFFVETLGRKTIQVTGLAMNALIFAIMAGKYEALEKNQRGLIACFIFLQFFFNFGANATTFIIPAEVFPTRVRGMSHGLSAACGKCGAIIASLAVSVMTTNLGAASVLWLFFGVALACIPFTFLIPESKGRDADVIDLQERQEALGYGM